MKKKLIVVVGPTASGKSDLTFKLAKDLNFETIVCDAYQVYKEISVGINKPSDKQLESIKHHFVNYISVFDEWNIKIFQSEIEKLINNNKNTNFILEGGSNLYIDCLLNNYDLKEVDMTLNYDHLTNEELFNKLQQLDYDESQKISINNRKRLIQALRIIETNNEKKSILDKKNKEPLYDFYFIRIVIDRKDLYEKINNRFHRMYENGWRQEIINLINNNNQIINTNAFKALGYREIYDAIINNYEPDLELIKKKTRNYAKRQETWIKNKFKIDFEFSNYSQYNELLKEVKNFLYGK